MQLFFLQGHLHLLKLALFTNIFTTTSWDVLLSPSTEFLSRGVADIMSFYDSNERQPKEIIAGINARTFWGDKMTVTLVTLEPHVILLSHSHSHEQAGYVLEGEIEFTISEQTQVLGPGDLYHSWERGTLCKRRRSPNASI